ncbi:MAG: hypothetical protein LKF36_01850 [Lactobacillus sp.]|jgi:hypothetical protein|nr:hypothetical protein [Lactobacillus sp.]
MALTDDLKKLVMDVTREKESPYISIFMGVNPNDTNIQKDKSAYKNLVAQAQKDFTSQYPKREWDVYQEEFDLIASERSLGRDGFQGMAVIASKTHIFRYYLNIQPEDQSYVSDNLYILPIIKDAQYKFDYDMLSIDKAGFKLYRVRDGALKLADLPADAPSDFHKAITDPLLDAQSEVHPEHAGNDVYSTRDIQDVPKDEDLVRYYKAVDLYVRQKFTLVEHVPVVLLGAEDVQDTFRKITKNGMLESNIKITRVPSKLDQPTLNRLKDDINAQFAVQSKAQILQELDNARSGGRETSGVDNVVQAAVEGRIRQVLIRDNTVEHGVIDLDMNVDTKSKTAAKHNLLNDIAVVVLAFGGSVHVLTDDEMPIGQSVIGLLRGRAQ